MYSAYKHCSCLLQCSYQCQCIHVNSSPCLLIHTGTCTCTVNTICQLFLLGFIRRASALVRYLRCIGRRWASVSVRLLVISIISEVNGIIAVYRALVEIDGCHSKSKALKHQFQHESKLESPKTPASTWIESPKNTSTKHTSLAVVCKRIRLLHKSTCRFY